MHKTIFLSLILLVTFSSIPRIQALEDYTYTGLSLNLYADGVAHAEYRVDVNPILARTNVTILGRHITNLFVKDQDGDLLESCYCPMQADKYSYRLAFANPSVNMPQKFQQPKN